MTITRVQAESILHQRTKAYLSAVDASVIPIVTNEVFNDPLGFALRKLGLSVTNVTAVADADVTAVTDEDLDAFLDLAEVRLMQNILGMYDAVDIVVGPRQERLSQLRDGLETRIDKMSAKISSEYGIGGATLEAGTIGLDFVDHNEDVITE